MYNWVWLFTKAHGGNLAEFLFKRKHCNYPERVQCFLHCGRPTLLNCSPAVYYALHCFGVFMLALFFGVFVLGTASDMRLHVSGYFLFFLHTSQVNVCFIYLLFYFCSLILSGSRSLPLPPMLLPTSETPATPSDAVFGALHCTHVPIQSPGGNNPEILKNRKGFLVNVQLVDDIACYLAWKCPWQYHLRQQSGSGDVSDPASGRFGTF